MWPVRGGEYGAGTEAQLAKYGRQFDYGTEQRARLKSVGNERYCSRFA